MYEVHDLMRSLEVLEFISMPGCIADHFLPSDSRPIHVHPPVPPAVGAGPEVEFSAA